QPSEVYLSFALAERANTGQAPTISQRGLRRSRAGAKSRSKQLLRTDAETSVRGYLHQEKAAPAADEPSTQTAHQPKTMPSEVPRLTLVRQAKPIPDNRSVQMVKRSRFMATA